MLSFNIKPEHLNQLRDILKQYAGGADVWAYGSRLTDKSHEGSDLDLVIRNGKDLRVHSTDLLIELKEALSESNIPFLVDVIDWASLPESFHQEILKNFFIVQEALPSEDKSGNE